MAIVTAAALALGAAGGLIGSKYVLPPDHVSESISAPKPKLTQATVAIRPANSQKNHDDIDLDADPGPWLAPVMVAPGRYSADANRVVTRLLKAYVDDRDHIAAMGDDSDRIATMHRLADGRVIVLAGDEAVPAAATARGLPEHAAANKPTYAGRALFSPDAKHLAWLAKFELTGGMALVVDGVVGPTYRSIRSITYSPDSKRLAYVAEKSEKKFCVVVDGSEQKTFDDIPSNEIDERHTYGKKSHHGDAIHFSADSLHVAYLGIRHTAARQTTAPSTVKPSAPVATAYFVFDGIEQPLIGPIAKDVQSGQIAISGDGSHSAYVSNARIALPDGRFQQALVLDGKQQKPFAFVAVPQFSLDGQRLVYLACDNPTTDLGPSWRIVDGAVMGKAYNFIDPYSVRLSPDGKHVSYRAFVEGSSVPIAAWNPREKKVGTTVTVLDGLEMAGHADIFFSRDGLHVALAIPISSASGDATTSIAVDGFRGPSVKGYVDFFHFSPDGKHYCYMAWTSGSDSDENPSVFLDGIEVKKLTGRAYLLRFSADDTLHALTGTSDGTLRMLELKIVAKGSAGASS